jgi:small-conductance mechanosensitive channel
MIAEVMDRIEQALGLAPELQTKIFNSLLILIVLWLAQRLVLGILRRRILDVRARYVWQKLIGYISLVIGFLWVGQIWFENFRSVTTYLGLLSAGLAIALRDLIADLVGWVYILFNRPFVVGDRVQISGVTGDVIDLRLFQFTLLETGNWVNADQSTGRIIHVPNGKIFTEWVANYESGIHYIWNELSVTVSLDSDWQAAKKLLKDIANRQAEQIGTDARERVKEASRRFMIYYANLTPTVYQSMNDKGIVLTVRYLCEPRMRRTTTDALWADILKELPAQTGVQILPSI